MDTDLLTIDAVNAMDRDTFVAAFGHVLEHSPALAVAAWGRAPFADCDALVEAFRAVLADLPDADALELLRAHPELGARRPMAAASVAEQASAGLDRAAVELQARLDDGNARYRERFGFPFIVAVRGMTGDEVAAELDRRLGHDADTERAEAVRQVGRIAELRIDAVVVDP